MPNSKQAKKRDRQNEGRRVRNKAARTSLRTAMKKILQAESRDVAAKELPDAMRRIDKAAKKRVIHPNTAARIKSRLSRAAQSTGG